VLLLTIEAPAVEALLVSCLPQARKNCFCLFMFLLPCCWFSPLFTWELGRYQVYNTYIAKQYVQPKINFSETKTAYEMRSDSFCSYAGLASAKKE